MTEAHAALLAEISPSEFESVLAALRDRGLTIGQCITALSVSNDNPYVVAAREAVQQMGDDVEIDDVTVIAEGDDGAWVLNWMWVYNSEAGVEKDDDEEEDG